MANCADISPLTGVSGRGPIRTIYMQLLPELRLFVMFETVL
jgi:hypothetical protein